MKMDELGAQMAAMPVVEIKIQFSPQTGQVQVRWPGADNILNLGLLEFAKATLIAEMSQAAQNKGVLLHPASALKQ